MTADLLNSISAKFTIEPLLDFINGVGNLVCF